MRARLGFPRPRRPGLKQWDRDHGQAGDRQDPLWSAPRTRATSTSRRRTRRRRPKRCRCASTTQVARKHVEIQGSQDQVGLRQPTRQKAAPQGAAFFVCSSAGYRPRSKPRSDSTRRHWDRACGTLVPPTRPAPVAMSPGRVVKSIGDDTVTALLLGGIDARGRPGRAGRPPPSPGSSVAATPRPYGDLERPVRPGDRERLVGDPGDAAARPPSRPPPTPASGMTTTNSSPPQRATRSKLRRFRLTRSASCLSTWSPAAWPWVSVDLLEAIDVEEDRRHRLVRLGDADQRPLDMHTQVAAG